MHDIKFSLPLCYFILALKKNQSKDLKSKSYKAGCLAKGELMGTKRWERSPACAREPD
jgi:hypothetical protein